MTDAATMRKRLENQTRYLRLVEAGLCVTCGRQPAATGQRRCDGCRGRRAEAAATKRERLTAAGRCVRCWVALSSDARRLTCFRCRLAEAERAARLRQARKEAADG